MQQNFYNIITVSSDTAEILIYGYIGMYDSVNAADFSNDFNLLETKYANINIRINSPGGDVYSGIAIFNCIRRSKREINIYIDGVAASMGAVIALCGKPVHMSSVAHMMLHRVTGWMEGNADDMRKYAEQMEALDKTLSDIIASKIGITANEVKSKWLSGTDNWFDATQALEAKLIDSIYDGPVIENAIPKSAKPSELAAFYNRVFTKNKPEEMKKLLMAFGLPENTTEDQAIAALNQKNNEISSLKQQNKELADKVSDFENKAKTEAEAKIKEMLDAAVTQGKITTAERPDFEALAKSNFNACKKAIDKLPAFESPTRQIANNNAKNSSERNDWTFMDWTKKDPKGLQAMKETDFNAYSALFKAHFDKDPISNK